MLHAPRLDHPHQIPAASEQADREAAADRLRHADEIGRDAEVLARAKRPELASHLHLVVDQHRPLAVADLPQPLHEAVPRQADPQVERDRLDDDGADPPRVVAEAGAHVVEIVVERHDGVPEEVARDAGAVHLLGHPLGIPRRGLDVGLADPELGRAAVVADVELQDGVAPRRRARHAHGELGRLGPGVDEAHALQTEALADDPRQVGRARVGVAEHRAALYLPAHRVENGGVGMAGEEGRLGEPPVDVRVPVDVDHPRSATLPQEDRMRIHQAEIAADAGRQEAASALQLLQRAGGASLEPAQLAGVAILAARRRPDARPLERRLSFDVHDDSRLVPGEDHDRERARDASSAARARSSGAERAETREADDRLGA